MGHMMFSYHFTNFLHFSEMNSSIPHASKDINSRLISSPEDIPDEMYDESNFERFNESGHGFDTEVVEQEISDSDMLQADCKYLINFKILTIQNLAMYGVPDESYIPHVHKISGSDYKMESPSHAYNERHDDDENVYSSDDDGFTP